MRNIFAMLIQYRMLLLNPDLLGSLKRVTMSGEPIYRITFFNQGQVYEIYARHVFQSDLWGFLEVEEFVFGERSQMIVDPSEEKLKNEFAEVKRSFIPMQSIVRIDEVEKEGQGKITEASGGNVSTFPFPNMAGVKPLVDN